MEKSVVKVLDIQWWRLERLETSEGSPATGPAHGWGECPCRKEGCRQSPETPCNEGGAKEGTKEVRM